MQIYRLHVFCTRRSAERSRIFIRVQLLFAPSLIYALQNLLGKYIMLIPRSHFTTLPPPNFLKSSESLGILLYILKLRYAWILLPSQMSNRNAFEVNLVVRYYLILEWPPIPHKMSYVSGKCTKEYLLNHGRVSSRAILTYDHAVMTCHKKNLRTTESDQTARFWPKIAWIWKRQIQNS